MVIYMYQPVSQFGTANTCIIYQILRLFMLKYRILLLLMLHTSIGVLEIYFFVFSL